ncbi:hypothetical protein [Prochlorococcus sp. MIT 1341]|uniref:hypothetical protein n=1 Tax=Prochlorococcus sp. MIT 1341 TaxID=3096221 RepID=UPI002A753E3C|nr:hypothetical protein [Prochlorococcus sp. MIT 1341]
MTITFELQKLLKAQADNSGLSVDELANNLLLDVLSGSKQGEVSESKTSNFDEFFDNRLEQKQYQETSPSILSFGETRFTDEGARAYTKAVRYEFQKHASLKGLSLNKALGELPDIAKKHHGDFAVIGQILMGRHELTGEEMDIWFEKSRGCPLQKTLQEWSGDSLPSLCRVFVQAIEV